MLSKLFMLLLCLNLFIITACGGGSSNDNAAPVVTEEEQGNDNDDENNGQTVHEPDREFDTRLSTELAVSGRRCEGGETVETRPERPTCERDQWLIEIDNINTCSADFRICTEAGVIPIIARLQKADGPSNQEFTYYRIVPVSEVSQGQREVINDVWVRAAANEETKVVKRNSI